MSEEGIAFGRWRLLPRTRLLVADGERVALGYVAALGAAGQPAEDAVAQLMELDPAFSLAAYARPHSRRANSTFLLKVLEGLRLAGVPQGAPRVIKPSLRVVRSG